MLLFLRFGFNSEESSEVNIFFLLKNLISFFVYFLAVPHSIWDPSPRPGIEPLPSALEVQSSFGLLPKSLASVFLTGDPNFRQI